MAIFQRGAAEQQPGGRIHFINIIKSADAPRDALIWKHPVEDFNHGSTLVVMPGEQAIFVNLGQIEQVFIEGTYVLDSQNYPFIRRLRGALSGGESGFHAVVLYVRTTINVEMLWGTSEPIDVYDRGPGMLNEFNQRGQKVGMGASGSYQVRITDPALFLREVIGPNVDYENQDILEDLFHERFMGKIYEALADEFERVTEDGMVPEKLQKANSVIADEVSPKIADALIQVGLLLVAFVVKRIRVVWDEDRQKLRDAQAEAQQAVLAGQASGSAEGERLRRMGATFAESRTFDVLQTGASNEGQMAGSMMGAGVGLGMGMPMGGMIGGMMAGAMAQPTERQPDLGPTVPADSGSTDERLALLQQAFDAGLVTSEEFEAKKAALTQTTSSPLERLTTAKQMLDAGLLTSEEFEAKKSELLKEL